jgi:hypothetical protein
MSVVLLTFEKDRFSEEKMVGCFKYQNDKAAKMGINEVMKAELATLLTEQPSQWRRIRCHKIALECLQIDLTGRQEGTVTGDAFFALHLQYPEDSYLLLAAAKSYLQNRDFQISGYGISMMEAKLQPGFLAEGLRVALLREAVPSLKRAIYPQALKSPECLHLVKFYWRAPTVFHEREKLLADIPKLVVLTQVSSKRGTEGSDEKQMFMRADRLEDFVNEHWGLHGLNILKAYQNVLKRVLKDTGVQVEHVDRPALTVLATASALSISAVSLRKEWDELIKCLLWIDQVLQTPKSPGLRRFRILLPEFCRPEKAEIIDQQLKVLEELIDEHVQGNRGELTAMSVFETKGLELYQYQDNSEGDEVALVHGEDCWKALFKRGCVGCYECSFPLHPSGRGKGLRIPFELMWEVAEIKQAISGPWGGLILAGSANMLVPTRVLDDERQSIQWHFRSEEPSKTSLQPVYTREGFGDGLPETSLEKLKGIAYIGWHESVKISLGVEAREKEAEYSGLDPYPHNIWKNSSRQIGISAGQYVTASMNQTQIPVATEFHLPKPQTFSTMVDKLLKSPVLIYDCEHKTAWMCPVINLTIYMMRCYIVDHYYAESCELEVAFTKEGIELLRHKAINPNSADTYGGVIQHLYERYEQLLIHMNSSNIYGIGFPQHSPDWQRCGTTFPRMYW